MARQLTPNRWNWSQDEGKWVFIELNDKGERICHYQLEPPKEFTDLTMKIRLLNEKLITCKNLQENEEIFNKMMKISKRMQCMGRSD